VNNLTKFLQTTKRKVAYRATNTKNKHMNLKELFLTIATLKHEPRLLREAFSPDVVSGKKRVKLPKYCWRDAVLKVVWPDGLPNALQNHYCPLFWVSNMFPLLWAMP
jgi:hypothetical protein